jgi:hypothetical protein
MYLSLLVQPEAKIVDKKEDRKIGTFKTTGIF